MSMTTIETSVIAKINFDTVSSHAKSFPTTCIMSVLYSILSYKKEKMSFYAKVDEL